MEVVLIDDIWIKIIKIILHESTPIKFIHNIAQVNVQFQHIILNIFRGPIEFHLSGSIEPNFTQRKCTCKIIFDKEVKITNEENNKVIMNIICGSIIMLNDEVFYNTTTKLVKRIILDVRNETQQSSMELYSPSLDCCASMKDHTTYMY